MNELLIPTSPGELIDKITILEIKSKNIQDINKLENVSRELELLNSIWNQSDFLSVDITEYKEKLYSVNNILWDIEDNIREKERIQTFDGEFIELARKVYITNDERSRIKKELNLLLDSTIIEEKSYAKYN